MNRKVVLGIVTVLILALVGIGIYKQENKNQEKEVIKVGAIVFLTGPQSSLGEEVKNAMDLAVKEYNSKNKNLLFEILYQDSKDKPSDGIMAFNKLALAKVPIIITTGDVVSLNIAPIARKNKVLQISTVAAGPDIVKDNEWGIRVWPQSHVCGKIMANFAHDSLKISSAAVLYINNEYGISSSKEFETILTRNGGIITKMESYNIADMDVRNQIIKLLVNKPQAIFVTGFGNGYASCIKQIRELEYKGLILTDNTLSISYFLEQTKNVNEGIYFASTLFGENSKDTSTIDFINNYKKIYKATPSFTAAFAYDAISLIINAVENVGYNSQAVRDAIKSTKNYKGANGNLSFNEYGEVSFSLVVNKIENGKIKTVSEQYNW